MIGGKLPIVALTICQHPIAKRSRWEIAKRPQRGIDPIPYDLVMGGNSYQVQPPNSGAVLGTYTTGITRLQDLLQRQEWEAADLTTQSLLLALAYRKADGYLIATDIDTISCQYWRSIDNLWRTHSNDRFGLSVQTQIWRDIGGISTPDWHVWCRFGGATGWYDGDRWLHWNDVKFSLVAPIGHLPRNGALMGWGLGDFWVGCGILCAIEAKFSSCQIISDG